jgi:RNA polymerase sigma factor (TIGR02999 family)
VGEITALLAAARGGRSDALDRLLDSIYPAFRLLAANLLSGEREGHTMQSGDLAHEAMIRLFLQLDVHVNDRTHLMALAGRQMRRILVEQARAKMAQRRGGGAVRVELPDSLDDTPRELESLLILDDLLAQLKEFDPRAAEVVELRFFAGLSKEAIAGQLKVNPRTVQRDWDAARAWLLVALHSDGA